MNAHDARSNALLAALPGADYRRLLPLLEPVELAFGQVLHEHDEAVRHVYLPHDSLVSLITLVDGHSALEVGLVGREGITGSAAALGADASPFRAVVQASGSASRMTVASFRRQLGASPPLRRAVLLHVHALMTQVARTAACNRFHRVPQRLARWLLMTSDRIGSERFHLTHVFLGHMLGVRRAGVSTAANALRKRKLISYSRGEISILDIRGLRASACSCYRPPMFATVQTRRRRSAKLAP
jgi:CRP-like cAMP-binding protein